MELRSNINTSRASNVIQRPPVSRVPRGSRESFPGRLIVPNIPKQLDIPSVNIIPPPALYTYSQDGGTSNYIDHDDIEGFGRIYSPVHTHAHHSRHMSVSSYATQYTQRTQSTMQAIPTRTLSTTRQHRRGRASFASTTGRGGRTSTPIHFFKRNLRRGSNPGGDNHDKIDADDYQELESQVTEPGSGFQYAATPSVDPLNVIPGDLEPPLPMPAMRARQPSPVPTSGEKRCLSISIVGGIKFLEELAKRLKIFFRAGRRVGEWKVSMRVKGSKGQDSRTEMVGSDSITDKSRGKMKAIPTPQSRHGQKNGDHCNFSWGPGEKTLRIKNNGTGSCVFMITTAPGNPQEIIETPLSLPYLQSQLFVHSKNLIRALEDWNKHFQNPPPHWVINFVPKAYLRRGWHLAEEVAEYLRTYGLNAEVDSSGFHRSAWKVEYEAIGHKACLVDEGGKPYGSELYRAGQNAGQNLGAVLSNGVRERHPSRCWERKEGWDGCRGLVVGIAL